jgi:NET1-associated nuclear protein 1 (U3 small nucleolar RNA-associated protein 17)
MSVVPEVQMVGGHFAQRAVTFSTDGKVFFACSGNGVTVFSVATGEQLQSLDGHSAEVTACVVHPQNSLQLITVSLDSTLRIWDFYDGVCLKTIALNHPALHLVSPNRAPPKTMPTTPSAAASAPSDSNILVYVHLATSKKRSVWSVNLSSSSVEHLYTSGRQCRALAVSPKGLYVASVNKNELYVYAVATRTVKRYAHARDLTVVAFHPTDPYLVTGAVDGQLILWFGFAGSATQPQPQITTSVLHWHAHPVQAATFRCAI